MKSKKLRTLLFILGMGALSASLIGCSSGGSKSESGKSPTKDDNSVTKVSDTDNSIVVGIPVDLDSLDPHKAVAAGTREVLYNIFEGLLKPTPNGDLVNAISKKYEISKNATEYTFYLRDDVKFHDGSKLTAEDVKYSIDRCAGKGGEPVLVPAFSIIDKVSIIDDYTVKISLNKSSTEILYSLTTPIISHKANLDSYEPIGTGPFKFKERKPDEKIVLERFDDYWGDKAFLDKVTFKVISDMNVVANELNSGAIQMFPRITMDQSKQIGDTCSILEGHMNLIQGLYLNNKRAPFDNEKVRQAMCYAINRQEIIDLVFDGKGTIIGSAMVPYLQNYYMPQLADKYQYNEEKAKELLKEAGISDGFTFDITVPSNYQQHQDTALVIKDQLAKIGITANIKLIEWGDWLSKVYSDRDYDSTVIGVDGKNLSATSYLSRYQSDAKNNFVNYSNKDFDDNYLKAENTLDIDDSSIIYRRCEEILADSAASVYIQDMANLVALNKDYEGFTFYPLYVLDMSTIKKIK